MTTYCTDIRFKIQNNLDYEISGTYRLPIETISHLVLPGQVMVSHCGYSRDIVAALKKFKKVYLYRDLREVVLSTAKAFNKHKKLTGQPVVSIAEYCLTEGNGLKKVILKAVGWRNDHRVLPVSFDDLISVKRRQQLSSALVEHMEWTSRDLTINECDVSNALQRAIDSPTITKSEGRSMLDDTWDRDCENWFQEHLSGIRVAPDKIK